MKYDMDDLARRVERRKNDYIKAWLIYAFLAIGSVIAAALVPERKFVVPAGIIIILVIFGVAKIIRKYKPGILYSAEISGINIKEEEIMGVREGKTIYRRYPNVPHNYSNHRSGDFPRSKIRGSVFLRLDNGDIYEVANLNVSQIEFYEDGDRMVKPAGARFPQVEGREVDRQVCPLCGRINHKGAEACGSCGLLIVKED